MRMSDVAPAPVRSRCDPGAKASLEHFSTSTSDPAVFEASRWSIPSAHAIEILDGDEPRLATTKRACSRASSRARRRPTNLSRHPQRDLEPCGEHARDLRRFLALRFEDHAIASIGLEARNTRAAQRDVVVKDAHERVEPPFALHAWVSWIAPFQDAFGVSAHALSRHARGAIRVAGEVDEQLVLRVGRQAHRLLGA